jgi:hypothetical protein
MCETRRGGTVRAASSGERPLQPGDVVEVRSANEILATLDEDGSLDAVPVMPEMLQHVGKRYTVSRRVEKICDTIAATGSRRMTDTVYLEDLRCDGSGHGGCQAGCRIYWKEAWLRRIDAEPGAGVPQAGTEGLAALEQLAVAGTRTHRELDGEKIEVWRCQATEAFRASTPLKVRYLGQYWRELTSRNYRLLRFVPLLIRAFFMELGARTRLLRPLPLRGEGGTPAPPEPLNLQPGDVVKVRSAKEIAGTLDRNGFNHRLSFDREMLPYCGRTCVVRDRVNRIIDDRTGRMLNIAADALILEGAVCSGERSVGRWFCPRGVYPFWREAWLVREEPSPSSDELA